MAHQAPGSGALGGGSQSSINPHGLQTSVLTFLAGLNPPKVQPPKKASVFNLPNAYNVLSDTYRMFSRESLGGKSMRRRDRITGQGISIAEEDLRKQKILFNENLASRGLGGKMREGKPAADWRFEGRQQNIELAKASQYEEKRRWQRGKLHRILFG